MDRLAYGDNRSHVTGKDLKAEAEIPRPGSEQSRTFIPLIDLRFPSCFTLMSNPFFEHPILNSPYACPERHWELDEDGQPTQKTLKHRRRAEFVTPIPKPRKRKGVAAQQQIVFDEGKGLSTEAAAV